MNRATIQRLLIATAAATALLSAGARAEDSGLTRAQVRAELAEARASGMLDMFGEAATTDAVIQARDLHNQTEALALAARYELQAQQIADAQSGVADMPDLASYVEAGPSGPLLVIVTFDGNGQVRSAETVSLAAID